MSGLIAKRVIPQAIFLRRGLSPVQAEIWSEFVMQVFALYDGAAAALREKSNWDEFTKKRGALSVVSGQSKNSARHPLEDAITAELGAWVNRMRLDLPANHFLRVHEVSFECEPLIQSKTRTGRHSRKADLRATALTGPHSPNIVVEAKPLRNAGDIASRYLAEQGIGCFFSADDPYTTGALAALFAYNVTESGVSLSPDILKALVTYKPTPKAVFQVEIGPDLVAPCTEHERDHMSLSSISIFHVEHMFPCVFDK